MKTRLAIFLFVVTFPLVAANLISISFSWDSTPDADCVKLYTSQDLSIPVSQWQLSAVIPGNINIITVQMAPGRQFFFVTQSNIWGESLPSNQIKFPANLTNSPGTFKATKN